MHQHWGNWSHSPAWIRQNGIHSHRASARLFLGFLFFRRRHLTFIQQCSGLCKNSRDFLSAFLIRWSLCEVLFLTFVILICTFVVLFFTFVFILLLDLDVFFFWFFLFLFCAFTLLLDFFIFRLFGIFDIIWLLFRFFLKKNVVGTWGHSLCLRSLGGVFHGCYHTGLRPLVATGAGVIKVFPLQTFLASACCIDRRSQPLPVSGHWKVSPGQSCTRFNSLLHRLWAALRVSSGSPTSGTGCSLSAGLSSADVAPNMANSRYPVSASGSVCWLFCSTLLTLLFLPLFPPFPLPLLLLLLLFCFGALQSRCMCPGLPPLKQTTAAEFEPDLPWEPFPFFDMLLPLPFHLSPFPLFLPPLPLLFPLPLPHSKCSNLHVVFPALAVSKWLYLELHIIAGLQVGCQLRVHVVKVQELRPA